jgi:hypothetical protein
MTWATMRALKPWAIIYVSIKSVHMAVVKASPILRTLLILSLARHGSLCIYIGRSRSPWHILPPSTKECTFKKNWRVKFL